jgi:hypothetical protein
MAESTDFGPFAALVGYIVAAIATVVAIRRASLGPMGKLRSPEEDIPQAGQRGAAMLCLVGMVGIFLLATPSNTLQVFLFAALCGVVWMLVFTRYSGLIGKHSYDTLEVKDGETRVRKIIGGESLKPEAERQRRATQLSIQDLLAGAAYKPDYLWDRDSRRKVKTHLMHLFLIMIVSGTLGATAAGFAIQVKLTGKDAATFIRPANAPGLENANVKTGAPPSVDGGVDSAGR